MRIALAALVILLYAFPVINAGLKASDESDSCVSRGIIYFMKEDFAKAAEEFTQAISINPKNCLAYYQRAKIYENEGEFNKAIEDYTDAIKIDPQYTQAYYYRGVLYQKAGQLDKAIEDYTKIIEIKTSTDAFIANAYNNRGLAFDKKNELDLAINDFTKAVDILPEQLNGYYNRGLTYIKLKAYPLAKADFEKEIMMYPDFMMAKLYRKTLAHFIDGEFKEAYEDIFTLLNLGEKINPAFLKEIEERSREKSEIAK